MCLGNDPCCLVCVCGCMEATKGVSKPPEATDPTLQNTVSHMSVVVYCWGGTAWPVPCDPVAPSNHSVFTGAQCVCWSVCVCVCERERNVVRADGLVVRVDGGKGITRAVFVQGTGLSSLTRTYTYKHAHTLGKNRGLLWTQPSWVHALQSHIVSLFGSLALPFSYLSLSLSNTNYSVCFSSSVTSLHTIFNLYSGFTSFSDIIMTSFYLSTTPSSWQTSRMIPPHPLFHSHLWGRCEKSDSWVMERDRR